MNCPNCQKNISDKSKFCNFCGATISPDKADPVAQNKVHVGDMFDGKWRVESKLGQGGMGAVFLAHDVMLDRDVAIKILATALCNDTEFVERFEREAKLTAKLEHPNIVPIYAVGRFGVRPFIVMKLLDGVPLTKLIKAAPNGLPVPQILNLMRQLCDGLGFIHSRDFVHRDIKSANIQVSEQGFATILDFGIIRDTTETNSKTRAGTLMGTPHYMSPEQAKGQKADSRADLYALGCIAFEMFTGHLPFTKGNEFAIIAAQVKTPPPDICAERKDVPPEVGVVVKKMLAKDPADRYQTAKELYEALERALTPKAPVVVVQKKASQPVSKTPSRSPSQTSLKSVSPSDKPSRPRMAVPGQERKKSPIETPRRPSTAKESPRDLPPAPVAGGKPIEVPKGKVEMRERPSVRRMREERAKEKKSSMKGIFTVFLTLAFLGLAVSVGVIYAWGHMPQMLPPALEQILEAKLRPPFSKIPALARLMPPDPAILAAEKAAAEAKAEEERMVAEEKAAAEKAAAEKVAEEEKARLIALEAELKAREEADKEREAKAEAARQRKKQAKESAQPPKQAEPSDGPPAPPPCLRGGPGVLRIITKPTWGKVTVDGHDWGNSPTTHNIKAGPHTVKVYRSGFVDAVEQVCVKEGTDPTIATIQLVKN